MNNNIRWNNNAVDKGYVSLPNLLLDYHEELGIDEKELLFLIKLSRHKDTFKVHDDKLIKGCQKTAQRRRDSLRKKGLLSFTELKEHFILPNGKPCAKTVGFTYNLSMINVKLQELLERMDEELNMSVDGTTVSEDETELGSIEDKNTIQIGRQSPPNNTNYNTKKKTKKNSSNKETTILLNNVNLDASKNIFLHSFKSCYPEVNIRNADLNTLQELKVSDFTFKNLKLWHYFIDHTYDNFLAKSNSLDMLLLLKNQTRFEKELRKRAFNDPELKKTIAANEVNIDRLNSQLGKLGRPMAFSTSGT